MATLSDYVSGTISLTNGSTDFTGSATGWLLAAFKEGDTIIDITGATEFMGVIAEITSNTAGKLTKAWEGPNLVDAPYRMRYQGDNSRVAAQSRNLVELLGNGNLQAVAGLSGSANQVIMFTGPGTMTTVPKADLTSGADYDVQVSELADRAAYDGQAEGFSVLVSDVGDGRAAIYSKVTNASGDWSAAAYVTGPASTIPGPVGVNWRGAYDNGTAYAVNDGVAFNGSSFRKLTNSAAGTAPSGATPPIDNTNWAVIAAKGTDGAGTGDMVGPADSSVDEIVVFSDTGGKNTKRGGKTIAEIAPEIAQWRLRGRKTAGTGPIETLTPAEAREAIAVPVGAYRNILINPLFDHNQRLVSGTVSLSGGAYGHDRMKAGASGCTYTFSTSNGVTTINITAGTLHQVIEAAAFAGRAGEYVASWTGTAQARINAGAYGASGAVKATCDGSANVTLEFNTGTVSLPQFERGYVTDFSARAVPQEDDLCFRYAERLYGAINPGMPTATGGPNKWASWIFKTRKRTTPTMSSLGVGYGSTNISVDKCDLGSPAADQPVIPDGAFASAEL